MSGVPPMRIDQITWDDDALYWASLWGLTTQVVESCIRNPQQRALDPRTKELGHPVLRHRRGDVVVVAGYREPHCPHVLYVTTLTGADLHGQGSRAPGGSGSSLPKSIYALHRKIKELGYTLTRDSHPKVVTADGRVIFSVPGTPSDYRTVPNVWRNFCRIHVEELRRKRT